MADPNVTKMGTMFDPALVTDLFNKVAGHSAIAKLSGQKAIPFTGSKEFTFNMTDGVQIVGEGGQKKANTLEMAPVVIKPLKMVYQARVTDEFLRGSSEQKLNWLKAFNDGAAVKYAEALDLAAIHGMNPYTGNKASFYSTNSLDGAVGIDSGRSGEAIDDAIDRFINEMDCDVNGIAFSKAAASDMAKVKVNGVSQYPEFKFGGKPATFAGINCDVNKTIAVTPEDADLDYTDKVVLGDFQNAFRWGYAAQMPLTIIEYGDPDGQGTDLKATNEVCLRLEAYIGWGILDTSRFYVYGDINESE